MTPPSPSPRWPLPLLLLVLLALVPGACASGGGEPATPTPAPLDPTGEWRGTTQVQGAAVPFSMVVSGTDGSYSASLNAGGDIPPISLRSTQVEGSSITMTGDVMGQGLTIVVRLDGDSFAGSWSAGGDSGAINGSRVPR